MALGEEWEWGLHQGEFVGKGAAGTKVWSIKPRKELLAEEAAGKGVKACA